MVSLLRTGTKAKIAPLLGPGASAEARSVFRSVAPGRVVPVAVEDVPCASRAAAHASARVEQ